MAKLKLLRDCVTGKPYLQDSRGMCFQRTSGALVWPWLERPGCIVVLGEALGGKNSLGYSRHDVHKLQEFQSDDPAELMDALVAMGMNWRLLCWATPLADKRAYMLEDLNRELRSMRRPVVRFGDPQGFAGKGEGLLVFYHAFAQRRTKSEKTLFIGPGRCADELAAMDFSDAQKSVLEWPSAAALCFALAEIDFNQGIGARKADNEPCDDLGGY